jgi:hypothetical protein
MYRRIATRLLLGPIGSHELQSRHEESLREAHISNRRAKPRT